MLKSAKLQATYSFKILISLTFIAWADFLFFRQPLGANLGVYALLVLAGLAVAHPLLLKSDKSRFVALLSLGLVFALVYDPGILSLALYLFSLITLLVLARRDNWPDFTMLVKACLRAIGGLLRRVRLDSRIKEYASRRTPDRPKTDYNRTITLTMVPLFLGLAFLVLFASANPMVGRLLSTLTGGALQEFFVALFTFWRWLFWLAIWLVAWTLLRARFGNLAGKSRSVSAADLAMLFSPKSVFYSLLAFNLLFALQNGLDMLFLWSGQSLPEGMSYATYARAGSYPLVFTALLAGAYVLAVFGEHQAEYRSKATDNLLYLWIAQNIFLMVSAMWRLDAYVEVYSLTYLRLAAFIWMALVASGFIMIIARLVLGYDNRWLLNSNALVLGGVLYFCCFVNFPAYIANYNVAHNQTASGERRLLDVQYVASLGPEALPALTAYRDGLNKANIHYQSVSQAIAALSAEQRQWQYNWRAFTIRNYMNTPLLSGAEVIHTLKPE